MDEIPFQYEDLAYAPGNFFGREEDIRWLYEHILTMHSISVFGERKIGKTFLFLHLIHSETLAKYRIPGNFLLVYLDISACAFSNPSDLFYKILERLSEKVTGKIKDDISSLLEEDAHFQKFEEIIEKIDNNDQKIVFFLDNLEHISQAERDYVFNNIRYLAQKYDVAFVISTLNDLKSSFKKKGFADSPFFNIFITYRLLGLDECTSRELIISYLEHKGQQIDSEDIENIIRFSGNSPFFLKLSCFFYSEWLNDHINPKEDLKTLLQKKLEPYHKQNWEDLSKNEQSALLEIMENGATFDPKAKSKLIKKGYIKEEKDELCITSESFYNYIKDIFYFQVSVLENFKEQIAEINAQYNLTKSDRNALKEALSSIGKQKLHSQGLNHYIFCLIYYLEHEMRNFIKKTLEGALGEGWLSQALDSISREEIEKRISEEKERHINFQYPRNPLSYALLETLRNIILDNKNWNLCFSKYFEDKKAFNIKMQEVINIRNMIAHFHPIHSNEAVTDAHDIFWLLSCMRK
jgi:hypothetical protein